MVLYICISIIVILLFLCINLLVKLRNKIEIDSETQKINEEILLSNSQLVAEREKRKTEVKEIESKISILNENIENHEKTLHNFEQLDAQKRKAFDEYCSVLDQQYNLKEEEYDNAIKSLQEGYENVAKLYGDKIMAEKKEMDKMREHRAAAQRVLLKEQEVEDNISFYTLELKPSDIGDLKQLENLKKQLNQPRILSMLIWQTYYQKPLKTLWTKILDTSSVVCGIYKITNINTKQCYIGQSVDVLKRWTQHAKCGLDIDTPVGNKLYQNMIQYGLYNFSWELLEKCSKEELNQREKYYIEMYDAYNLGFNSTGGNK